ncbi:MAG: ATP-binding protein [Paludibacteraceae bacterium]|nr:ATP-binding protein [Paludibacteraceae bacterium]
MQDSIQNLHFRFDVSTFRLLGRELITDRITALFELVKNCYDANATEVKLSFLAVNPKSDEGRILIEDNGIGMTEKDIKDKWMVIGTSSKRRNTISPAPFCRRVVGKKGVGRFAVDKLGAKMILRSKQKGEEWWNCLETDWSKYAIEEEQQMSNLEEATLFTDFDNKFWQEPAKCEDHGTTLELSILDDVWTERDIQRAYKELTKLVRPNRMMTYPFQIRIFAPQYSDYSSKLVESMAFSEATITLQLDSIYDKQKKCYYQEEAIAKLNNIEKKVVPSYSFGPISMTLYYYDQEGKRRFSRNFKEDKIDGVKVYRDGIIATPFAEFDDNRDKQKDLFGIDKRRWSNFFDKISTRDVIGWVDITADGNPNIIDATNRQDFVTNEEWIELRKFVVNQLTVIEEVLKNRKTKKVYSRERKLQPISTIDAALTSIKELSAISNTTSEIQSTLNSISSQLTTAKQYVRDALDREEQVESAKHNQENLMYSLISLQSYAAQISHIVRTSIGMIKRSAEFVVKWLPLRQKEEKCVHHATMVYDNMNKLSKAVNFMLAFAKDGENLEPFDVSNVTLETMKERYEALFKHEGISVETIVPKTAIMLNYNDKVYVDMLGCLIDNSVKALRNTTNKKIKCELVASNDSLRLFFSDNGEGVKEIDKEHIFDEFYTTTAHLGGSGLGLFMIKMRLQAIKGSIELVQQEFLPTGATFCITIPFAK